MPFNKDKQKVDMPLSKKFLRNCHAIKQIHNEVKYH